MWGTDYPLIGHAESLEQIAELDLKPEALYALLRGTALEVFKLEDSLAPAAADVAETTREA
jgi:predicted TIM-barrel fold metal-dependent hydrolase